MSSSPSPVGQVKGWPFPEGIFEQLAQQGDELLQRTDWISTKDQRGFLQQKIKGKNGQPSIACGRGTFSGLPIDTCVDTMVVHMKVKIIKSAMRNVYV